MIEPKKNPNKDLNKTTGLFFNVGLVISFLIVIWVFEYKVSAQGSEVALNNQTEEFEDLMDIPQTQQPPPPKPTIQHPEIIEVPDEEEIEEEIEIDLDIEMVEEDAIQEVIFDDVEIEEEDVDEIFTIVQSPQSYPGGISEFYKWFGSKMKYPAQARRMGIQGRVFVEFTIEKDGSITDVKTVKGIGAGCDEEAARVMKTCKPWNPGKNRGRPVRVRMILPIKFTLL